ncbi:hypothetical protein WUBG_15155 [Wuchereria bancrofti]|uniref:Uncharacterized protein n=1 Tax=Wuchereria bancrofti TaxID=6293 RepID=J9DW63_WUCBA|nr:hypothetical protein WUBG_15155 [Wuchereria bancrofti]
MLSCDETNAQLLNFNILSFNNNRAGDNSLNGNGNAGARPSAVPANQAQQNPFGTWQSALGAGLGFLAGSFLGRGLSPSSSFSYGYYPYYSYSYYYPYYRGSNYRSSYNYYPYYYYYRG